MPMMLKYPTWKSNETFSIDSNGPSQTVKMPASNIKAQLTKNFSNICELFHPIIHKSWRRTTWVDSTSNLSWIFEWLSAPAYFPEKIVANLNQSLLDNAPCVLLTGCPFGFSCSISTTGMESIVVPGLKKNLVKSQYFYEK